MTGYASKTKSFKISKEDELSLQMDLKSINTRFFECSCRLPSILNPLEIKIIHSLKAKLLRGRVFLNVKILETDGTLTKISPSKKLLEEYLRALNVIKKEFKIAGEVTLSDILNLPNIFSSQTIKIDEKTQIAILTLIDNLADELIKSRALEGAELKKDLDKRFNVCAKNMEGIKKYFKAIVALKKKEVKKLLLEYEKDPKDEIKLRLDELYSILNKIDIQEEVVRFESHLKNAKQVIKDNKTEKGKRLDFILQELLRESNTTLAKSSDYKISKLGVDIKVELEKIREQIQNIV